MWNVAGAYRGRNARQAGKHVYLDKPMALNAEDANRIVDAVAKSSVRSQMFSNIHSAWAAHRSDGVDEWTHRRTSGDSL